MFFLVARYLLVVGNISIGRKDIFSSHINRKCFYLNFGVCDKNCCTIKNLSWLDSILNEALRDRKNIS